MIYSFLASVIIHVLLLAGGAVVSFPEQPEDKNTIVTKIVTTEIRKAPDHSDKDSSDKDAKDKDAKEKDAKEKDAKEKDAESVNGKGQQEDKDKKNDPAKDTQETVENHRTALTRKKNPGRKVLRTGKRLPPGRF
ncbi:MAG: hypothetical protein ACOCZ2_02640 [Thermodesulfobacteriota bacterium]